MSICPRDADAQAYQVVQTCGTLPQSSPLGSGSGPIGIDTTGKLCVNATVSASVTGFAPNGNFANLTATNASASVALPAGAVVYFQNTGTTTVSCTLGVGSATATTNEIQVPPSSGVPLTVGSNTFGACIDQTGSASNVVVLAGGSGLANAFGGGSSTGSGGSVTQGTVPWVVSVPTWAGGTLGAMANYGTSPGTVLVPGVNANVTNANPNGQAAMASSSPVVIANNQSAVPITGAVNVTATACSGTITSGGTAQNAFTAQTTLHGFTIANIDTTEPLWISFTGTAAASGTDSYPLPAATATTFASFGSFTAPPGFGLNHALSVIAVTTSHKFSCTWW